MITLKERVDPFFAELGIKPGKLGLTGAFGSKYQGDYKERVIKANVSRRTRTRYSGPIRRQQYAGHRVNLSLSTPLKTQLVIAPAGTSGGSIAGFINKRSGMIQMTDLGPDYEGLTVYAREPEWARPLLTNESAKQAISQLLPQGDLPKNIAINFQPESVLHTQLIGLANVTPSRLKNWVEALEALIQVAEAIPAPKEIVELSKYQVYANENPTMVGCGIFAALFAIVTILGLCCAAIPLTLSLLPELLR